MSYDPTTNSREVRIGHIYRLAAEAGCDAVLDYMHAEFSFLRHPYNEKRLVANIARGRSKELAHAQN